MKNKTNLEDFNGGNQMETLVKIETSSKTATIAHSIKQANGIVLIEFKGGK